MGTDLGWRRKKRRQQCPLRVLACFDVSAGLFGAGQGADCSSPCPPSWKEADYPKSSVKILPHTHSPSALHLVPVKIINTVTETRTGWVVKVHESRLSLTYTPRCCGHCVQQSRHESSTRMSPGPDVTRSLVCLWWARKLGFGVTIVPVLPILAFSPCRGRQWTAELRASPNNSLCVL